MNDTKAIVAKNITELRIRNNLTQMELAEKLNYSDKTISKWERGESSPDIAVLVELANLFDVTLDCLVRSENVDDTVRKSKKITAGYNRRVITYIAESATCCIALFAFIITSLITSKSTFQWLYFVYTPPILLIIKLVLNSIWFNTRHNYVIVSALIWTILATIHITFLYFGKNVALIYLLGIVGQIIVILCSFIKKPKTR